MKNNLVKLYTAGALVTAVSVLAPLPANAIQLTLGGGDFINIATYGALFTGEEFEIDLGLPFDGIYNSDGALITKAEFDDNSGFANNFIPPNGFARADINSTNISAILGNYTTNIGVARIRSVDLTNTDWFLPTTPTGPDVSFPATNTFDVLPAFGNFIEIDDPAIPGSSITPDLAIRLLSITTSQNNSLLTPGAQIGVGFSGIVEFITTGSDGQQVRLGTGSFSTTFPSSGSSEVEGSAIFSFVVDPDQVKVPEASPVSGLIGLGLLGSVLALKKKVQRV
ncbi:hypothetical protein Cyast_1814 [Cyanobacterium stanieri PCC 7202]|uniref:PEP motif anchor domain protein n=1 Tax=Cyanobacterium stanieri (strain ATCC 29140 / PCC 7202) TaxID=292563 RepID=K9YMY9_CYASC|nr:hypothetical protein Cyast_1814 [Cyanobacterium stanieri PCC 7202]